MPALPLLLSLLAHSSPRAGADPFHLIVDDSHIRFSGPSSVELPRTASREHLFVVVESDPAPPHEFPGQFPEDFFQLAASTESPPLGTCEGTAARFESTYGEFELVLADLTGDGVEEFILAHGDGRGTAVRTEQLDVYRLDGTKLVRIFQHQLSDRPSEGCR